MNPMLYWMGTNCPEAFNDITFGNNQFDNQGNKCQYGFPAAAGWDVSTFPSFGLFLIHILLHLLLILQLFFLFLSYLKPVTGLGSIKFEGFVSCAMKYQDIFKKSSKGGKKGNEEDIFS